MEEYVGKPHVITLNINNLTEVDIVIKENINKTVSKNIIKYNHFYLHHNNEISAKIGCLNNKLL